MSLDLTRELPMTPEGMAAAFPWIGARMVADSISPAGVRISTLLCHYPRFIHSELMTHRAFSRNAASSRAIPLERTLARVQQTPALPVWWGANQRGMTAEESLTGGEIDEALTIWLEARDNAVASVRKLQKVGERGLHKQIANRLLEPWMLMETLVTATEWWNFFDLRLDPAAQPEFQLLSHRMWGTRGQSEPALLEPGQWHMPYWGQELAGLSQEDQLKVCVARAGRLSYLNFDGSFTLAEDLKVFDRLKGHYSPFEHPARCQGVHTEWSGNFFGWDQYRKIVTGLCDRPENIDREEDVRFTPEAGTVPRCFRWDSHTNAGPRVWAAHSHFHWKPDNEEQQRVTAQVDGRVVQRAEASSV